MGAKNNKAKKEKKEEKEEDIEEEGDIAFFIDNKSKKVLYRLINEKNELLLYNKKLVKNGNYDIKIQELFKGEDSDGYYYINKEKLTERYLKPLFEIEKESKINNKDKVEMNSLYEETILKHPREKFGKIYTKFSFFSWSGFFCFGKCPSFEKTNFFSLGFGITSYFNTIKLLALFFFIIFLINIIAIVHYCKYNSIIKNDSILVKTTLGNTMITKYNSVFISFNSSDVKNENSYYELSLNCSKNLVGKFIYGVINNDLNDNEFIKLNNISLINQKELRLPKEFTNFKSKWKKLANKKLNEYNKEMEKYFLKNEITFNVSRNLFYDKSLKKKYQSKLLFYECIDKSLLPKNSSKNSLKKIIQGTTIVTFFLIITLYFYYKFAIFYGNEEYYHNNIYINNYTLVLHSCSLYKPYNYLNDLIKHLNHLIEFSTGESMNSFNIFDINMANVNEDKISSINNLKAFVKSKIGDTINDNDTIKGKILNKVHQNFINFVSLFSKNSNKNTNNLDSKDEKLMPKEDDNEKENIKEIDNDNEKENIKEIENENKKENYHFLGNDINEEEKSNEEEDIMNIISTFNIDEGYFKDRIGEDIYITFKNPKIANIIYTIYHYNYFQKLFFIDCLKRKDIYYFHNEWLKFEYPDSAPDDIRWENYFFYYSRKERKFCSFLVSFFIIIISTLILTLLNVFKDKIKRQLIRLSIILICQIVSISTTSFLKKYTESEKNCTFSENVSSNIKKYFYLNFLISGISVNLCYFTYNDFVAYSDIITCLLSSMILSIFTVHASILFFYFLNLFKRYLDSKCQNGRTTKITSKLEYEKLYLGPEFPIDERYSSIFVNLAICLLYGTY